MCATSSSTSVGIPQQPGTDSLGVQVNQGPLCVAGQLEGAQDRHGKSSCCLRGHWDQKVHLASCPGVISAALLPGHKHGATRAKKQKRKAKKKKTATPNCKLALAGEATIVSTKMKHQWQCRSVLIAYYTCHEMYLDCVR